jgi:UDP-xylose/UDP-N-acetylglucosamine transporter B4
MLGNKSLDWGLPLPLFFLIKCGNLAASMLVGFVLVGKKYAPRQIIAVSFVTLGLLLSTASANKGGAEGGGGSDAPVVGSVIVGAVALFLALVSNSLLGVVQEVAFRTYGKVVLTVSFVVECVHSV